MNRIVIHYSEIALKGKNRRHFEDALLRHVREALGAKILDVRKVQGEVGLQAGERSRSATGLRDPALHPGDRQFLTWPQCSQGYRRDRWSCA